MSIIEDGKGKGFAAEVDDHGRLYVKSNVVSHMAHHSTYHKNGYFAEYDTVLQGTSETPVMFLYNNNPTTDLEIYGFSISSTANVEIVIKVGETFSSGGVEVVPVNTNLGTNVLPTIINYEGGASGDLVLTTTNSKTTDGVFLGAYKPYDNDYNGALVITPNTGVVVYATGTSSDKIKVAVTFSLHATGVKL